MAYQKMYKATAGTVEEALVKLQETSAESLLDLSPVTGPTGDTGCHGMSISCGVTESTDGSYTAYQFVLWW